MTVEAAVCTRLQAMSPLTALVSTRIYLEKLPQRPTLPAVVVTLVDDLSDYHLRGETNLLAARVQVDEYAAEAAGTDAYATVSAVAAAVHGNGRGTLATGLSGWIGRIPSAGIRIAGCRRVSRRRQYAGDELRIMRMMMDYIVTYKMT